MLLLVGRRVVDREKGIETCDAFLCGITAHLLRLVKDNDWPVLGNDVDRLAASEVITLSIDNKAGLVLCPLLHVTGKGLGVDDHHLEAAFAREAVKELQVLAAVDKKAGFLAILLHEVVLHGLKALVDALADRDAGDDNDKLGPAVALVELKHGLDVDIGLSGASLHLDIELHPAELVHQLIALRDIAVMLDFSDISEEIHAGCYRLIGKALSSKGKLIFVSKVADIREPVMERLSLEDIHHGVNRVGLVLLYLECEFHPVSPLSPEGYSSLPHNC